MPKEQPGRGNPSPKLGLGSSWRRCGCNHWMGEKLDGFPRPEAPYGCQEREKNPHRVQKDKTIRQATRGNHSAGSPLISKATPGLGYTMCYESCLGVKAGQGWQIGMQRRQGIRSLFTCRAMRSGVYSVPRAQETTFRQLEGQKPSPLGLWCLGVLSQVATKLARDASLSVDCI